MNDFTIILRSMTARMFSTVMTVLSVAVAVALLLTLLTMAESGKSSFDRGSGNMHVLVSTDASPLVGVLNGIYYAGTPRRPIPWAQYQDIAKYGPAQVPPGMTPGYAIPIQIGDSFRGMPVVATTPEFFTRFEPVAGEPWKLDRGEFFDGNLEVVLGAQAAANSHLNLGDTIVFTHGSGDSRGGAGEGGEHAGHTHDGFRSKVVGILKPTGSAHDRALFVSIETSWLMHAFDRLEREGKIEHHHDEAAPGKDAHEDHDGHDDHDGHEGHDHGDTPIHASDLTDEDRRVTGIYLRVPTRPGSDASAVLPAVFDALRRDATITVASPRQEIDRLFSIVAVFDKILRAMAAVVLLGSGISISVALYNSMEQRRRQIAILRVLGCSRARVFGLVLTEAALIGVLGALAGVVLSMGGGQVVSAVMMSRYGVVITPVLPADLALGVVLATILLAALAGLVPAALAYRTPVATNLRPIG